ncbi:hypothetical protein Ancab_004898 [Ancistrocladus abbreviatus]
MGNCCGRDGSSMVLKGKDWGPAAAMTTNHAEERQGLLGERSQVVGRSKELRIKISRKQLEELLRRDDGVGVGGGRGKGVPVEEVLARLIEKSQHFEIHSQQTWRPALDSIPEVE